MTLAAQLEAILFFKAEPLTTKELAALVEKTVEEIDTTLGELSATLSGRGIVLVRNGDEVMLETAPEAAELIKTLVKETLSRDLGKAALEVLSLVLYRGPVSKSEIDYVRGVNSSFILRNLMIRGLVERAETTGKQRSFQYKPTFELLAHLGVKNVEELPEYTEVQVELAKVADTVTEKTDSAPETHE